MDKSKAPLFFIVSLAMFGLVQLTNASAPYIFIFGDSTVDVGTNNYLPNSTARANFPHNGIDFPKSTPTGRFSNGFNGADFLAKLLHRGISPPPFLYINSLPFAQRLHYFKGANFASGGAGLLDITGNTARPNNDVPMTNQIKQLGIIREELSTQVGWNSTAYLLSQSIYYISVGSNDLFAYFYSNSTVPPLDFLTALTNKYEEHIKNLYNLGARKFGIINVGPLGCIPSQRLGNATGGCLEGLNDFTRAFNAKIGPLLVKLRSELKGINYSVGNTYEIFTTITNNPRRFRLTDVQSACCGDGRLNAQKPCVPTSKLCSNRNEFLFWDGNHATEAGARIVAWSFLRGSSRYVAPITFRQLAENY